MISSFKPALVFHPPNMIYLDPAIQTYAPTMWILIVLRMVNFTAKERTSEYPHHCYLAVRLGAEILGLKKKKRISGSKFQDTLSNVRVLTTAK